MSDCTLVFKAGGGGIFTVGVSVGTVMIKLTNNENLTCKVMMLVGLGMGGEAVLLGIGAVHGMVHFLSPSSI